MAWPSRTRPRSAAKGAVRVALDREAFLVAITGNSLSSAAADALVTQRLTADSPTDRIRTALDRQRRSGCDPER
jgi:hypothetical protein